MSFVRLLIGSDSDTDLMCTLNWRCLWVEIEIDFLCDFAPGHGQSSAYGARRV